jgi:hypothetical protein
MVPVEKKPGSLIVRVQMYGCTIANIELLGQDVDRIVVSSRK